MSDDIKFLKYKTKVLAVNKGNTPDVLDHDITVPTYRGYRAGEVIPAGTKLSDIVKKEFQSSVPTHTITVRSNSGGTVTPGTTVVDEGSNLTVTATPNEGYRIASFKVDGATATNPYTFTNIIADHTVEVEFEEIPVVTFAITASASEHGSISPSGVVNVVQGTDKTFNFTPDEGYVVDKIVVDGADEPAANSFTFTNVQSEHTINAVFKPATTYNVTSSVRDGVGGTILPEEVKTFVEGSSITLPYSATPDGGYVVDCWYVNDQPLLSETGTTYTLINTSISSDITVQVKFKLDTISYKITGEAGEHGSISPNGTAQSVEEHTASVAQPFTATPDSGYKVKQWLNNGTVIAGETGTTYTLPAIADMAQDVTIKVEFEPLPAGFIAHYYIPEDEDEDWLVPTESNMILIDKAEKTQEELDQIKANGDTFEFVASSGNQQPIYVYPASMGAITDVVQSGFHVLNTWATKTMTIDGIECIVFYKKGCTSRGTFELSWS